MYASPKSVEVAATSRAPMRADIRSHRRLQCPRGTPLSDPALRPLSDLLRARPASAEPAAPKSYFLRTCCEASSPGSALECLRAVLPTSQQQSSSGQFLLCKGNIRRDSPELAVSTSRHHLGRLRMAVATAAPCQVDETIAAPRVAVIPSNFQTAEQRVCCSRDC